MANNIIQLIIAAKNEASGTIKQVSKDIKDMDKAAKKGEGGGGLGLLGGAGTIAAIVGTGVAIAATANEAAKSAAEFERLQQGTNALGAQYNLTSSDILSAIDGITQGTLSNTTILQQANQAMLLGVADTADEFSTLAKIAVDRGRKMGIGIEKAFSSIVLGVGRLSPLILDNLGIVIDADNTYKAYAETIGKTADSLNDFEKRQALLAKLKSEVSNFDSTQVLDNASAWERFDAAIRNLSVSAGGLLNDWGVIVDIVNAVSTTLNNTAILINTDTAQDEINSLKKSIELLEEEKKKIDSAPLLSQATDPTMALQFWNNLIGGADLYETRINEIRAQIAEIESGMKEVTASTKEAADSGAALADETTRVAILNERLGTLANDLGKEYGFTKTQTEEWKNSLIDAEGSLEGAIAKATQLTAQMYAASQAASAVSSALGGALSALEGAAVQAYRNTGGSLQVVAAYEQARATLNDTLAVAQELGITESQLPFFMSDAQEAATGYFDAINDAATATEKTASGTKSLTAEFTSLRGIVSGIFEGMFSDIGGVKVEDFLPREDAPNEAARRIADVMVKGFESPWADYFKTSFPELFSQYMGQSGGDVKNAAALLLRDFQNGLRPELIDTNVVKELAKRAFQVDQSTSAMIDQVAKELADELGISIEQATGYASGAAGKPIVSEDAIKQANKSLSLKPNFDFGSAQADFQAAGQAVGLFDSAGKLIVTTGVVIESVSFDMTKIGVMDFPITPVVSNPDAANAAVMQAIGMVNPVVYLDYSLINGGKGGVSAATNIAALVGNVMVGTYLAMPATDKIETWKQGLMSYVGSIGVPVSVLTPDLAAVDTAILPMKNEIIIGLTSGMSPVAQMLVNNLQLGLDDNIMSIQLMGLNLGINMYQGFAQYPLGAILASELTRQVDEAQKTFENSGKSAGTKWGNAFLDVVGENVPIELLNILTDLITPEVQARLAGEGTR